MNVVPLKPPGVRPGWVTVAAAAAALTSAGDKIDASNVSRYLARNPAIGQERIGKYRYVDLAALFAHRNTSLFVADKRQSRGLALVEAGSEHPPSDQPSVVSTITGVNVELKQLELRRKLREDAIESGALIPADEVRTICVGVLEAFAAELARQENHLTAKLGRDVGMQIRKAHRAARAAACSQMIAVASSEVPRPDLAEVTS